VFYNSSHPIASTLLFLTYEALGAILLINVLVAAMVASYEKVRVKPLASMALVMSTVLAHHQVPLSCCAARLGIKPDNSYDP
jgi:hypothetical protein